MSKIKLEINTEVRRIFNSKGISIHDGMAYLLCLYYGIEPSYIPESLERKVLACGIVTKDYSSDTVVWKIPLFNEQETGFEWIGDWMDLFKKVNPERRGTKQFVLTRMKRFFVNNPSIRKDEVFSATEHYLKTVDNPKYCKKSHKFIYEQDGSSMLFDYVDQLKRKNDSMNSYTEELI